jgi:hypothetical protein
MKYKHPILHKLRTLAISENPANQFAELEQRYEFTKGSWDEMRNTYDNVAETSELFRTEGNKKLANKLSESAEGIRDKVILEMDEFLESLEKIEEQAVQQHNEVVPLKCEQLKNQVEEYGRQRWMR